MIPAAFDYTRAASLQDALAAISTPGTRVIAGGQSLIPLMRFRKVTPAKLIDIGHLDELRGITVSASGVRIGAATPYRALIESAELRAVLPLVPEVTEYIGDLQLRNLGTIGGALVYADPFADMPAALMALNATFVLQSVSGERRVAAREFFVGAFTTAIAAGELLIAIEIPALAPRTGTAYANFEKSASGYSQVAAAASVTRDAAGVITAAALAVTCVAAAPFVASAAALVGTTGGADVIAAVAAEALRGVTVYPDPHTTVEYRVHLAQVAVRRALEAAVSRATA
jgi:aerobic carbon-monoxide dehydrogenase medium subunit